MIEHAPFEVTEQGWGEFVIGIVVQFHDSTLRAVEFSHSLRLFPADASSHNSKMPVVAEHYDEFVFQDPTEEFYQTLQAGPQAFLTAHPHLPYCTKQIMWSVRAHESSTLDFGQRGFCQSVFMLVGGFAFVCLCGDRCKRKMDRRGAEANDPIGDSA